MLFDSHCHLDDPRLRPQLPAILAEAEAAGVTGFLVPGVAPDGWPGIAGLADEFPHILPAFGVHPMHADLVSGDTVSELRRRCRHAVAIGEIGLDYLIDYPAPKLQREAFRAQLRVAAEFGLPVLIHCRKGFPDLLEILAQERVERVGGVLHAFSGSPEIARECLRLGLHISLAGSVTYQNAVRPVAVAASLPLERLLLESDAPDLAPEPHRGGINLPKYLAATAERVAAIRGIALPELARATTQNASRLFRLPAKFPHPGATLQDQ
jgi:TatD DNase family protein